MMLGRQQVKTRVEKSPFNVINNQVANNQTVTHQMGRGGKENQQKLIQNFFQRTIVANNLFWYI